MKIGNQVFNFILSCRPFIPSHPVRVAQLMGSVVLHIQRWKVWASLLGTKIKDEGRR